MRKLLLIFLVLIIQHFSIISTSTFSNVKGHSIDPNTGKIDDTQGCGAFDSIVKTFGNICPNNFDNGGGEFDVSTKYIKSKYNINNVVYDPFMRTEKHNKKAINQGKKKPFDCSTSMSVLNVIDKPDTRLAHIKLSCDLLKNKGCAFFKVWPGNRSAIESKKERYQSNKDATYYVDEVKKIFGNNNVFLIDDKTIIAIKN